MDDDSDKRMRAGTHRCGFRRGVCRQCNKTFTILPDWLVPFGGRASLPEMFLFRLFIVKRVYIISGFGTRSPSRIAKRCKAAFQFCTGMVHFFAMCSSARYSSLSAAS